MICEIPTYIERRVDGGQSIYSVRPVFFDMSPARNSDLDRALSSYRKALHRELADLAKQANHSALAGALYSPDFYSKSIKWEVDLRKRSWQGQWLFVVCDVLDRRVAFSPRLPELWIELPRAEELSRVVHDALTRHFREVLKRGDLPDENCEPVKRSWVTVESVSVHGDQRIDKPSDPLAALMGGGEEKLSGSRELRNVGRCLDDELPSSTECLLQGFEAEVAELLRGLGSRTRRAVLLVGPSLVGKSAIIQETVRRRLLARPQKSHERGRCWLLSPQRLIAGMSYVGQWENRVHAIMKHAKRRNLLLYFNDLIGLLWAGRSSGSDLNVGSLLKMYLEDESVRVVAEATPEVYRRVREMDRAFADQFQVLRVNEPSADEILDMTIGIRRQLEVDHGCWFETNVVPVALNLQRRYFRHQAFPGKAAAFLKRVAAANQNAGICAADLYANVAETSGVSPAFLDVHCEVDRDRLLAQLGASVIGQPEAVAAVADAFLLARAGLNDPGRPLGVFVFLGPTGVGKTQCAKSAAQWLLGSADRLLRFDMNEYGEPGAAQRLLGTPWDPEGALTGAVRRQPFGVLLLDEIEKAHREVYDLLLQVTGEGRLTDALGRTVDFSNILIILTTNLGAREAMSRPGFVTTESDRQHSYEGALARWFRPEFLNRLDAVVPFRSLGPNEIAKIAKLCLSELLQRSGIVRRRCLVEVDDDVAHAVGQDGFHPLLGARALKRHVEQRIAQPIAARLAALGGEEPVFLQLTRSQDEPVVRPIRLRAVAANSAAGLCIDSVSEWVQRLLDWLEQVAETLEEMAPIGPLNEETLAGDDGRYFEASELHRVLCARAERLQADISSRRKIYRGPRQFARSTPSRVFTVPVGGFDRAEFGKRFSIADALDPEVELQALLYDPEPRLRRLLADAAWLQACLEPLADSATLTLSRIGSEEPLWFEDEILEDYRDALTDSLNLNVSIRDAVLHVQGPGAARLLAGEHGLHIGLEWFKVEVNGQGMSPEVVRIRDRRRYYDVASAWMGEIGAAELATLMIASLPLPDSLLG